METEFLSVEELSKFLGLKAKTIYSICRRGELPCYKFGRLLKFKRSDIEAWVEGNRKTVDIDKSAQDILKSIERKDKKDINGIIKKTIDEVAGARVKSNPNRKSQATQKGE